MPNFKFALMALVLTLSSAHALANKNFSTGDLSSLRQATAALDSKVEHDHTLRAITGVVLHVPAYWYFFQGKAQISFALFLMEQLLNYLKIGRVEYAPEKRDFLKQTIVQEACADARIFAAADTLKAKHGKCDFWRSALAACPLLIPIYAYKVLFSLLPLREQLRRECDLWATRNCPENAREVAEHLQSLAYTGPGITR